MRTPNLEDLISLKNEAVKFMKYKTANQYNFAGLLKTKFKGQGLEFDNIRDYSYGMEVRNIDWNVTARTGKVHIREFVTEKENNLDIIMDVSPNMQFASFARFKYFIASEILAIMSFAASLNMEKLSYWFFGENLKNYYFLQQHNSQNIVFEALNFICQDHGLSYLNNNNNLANILLNYKNMLNSNGVLLIITDFNRLVSEFSADLKSLLIEIAKKKHIILLDIYDEFEINPPRSGTYKLRNYEGFSQYLDFSDNDAALQYKNMIKQFKEQLNLLAIEHNFLYFSLATKSNYEDFMKLFLI